MLGVKAACLIHAIETLCAVNRLSIGDTSLKYNSFMHFNRVHGKHTVLSRQQLIFPAGRTHLIRIN